MEMGNVAVSGWGGGRGAYYLVRERGSFHAQILCWNGSSRILPVRLRQAHRALSPHIGADRKWRALWVVPVEMPSLPCVSGFWVFVGRGVWTLFTFIFIFKRMKFEHDVFI
jgi:hypothetical protein